MEILLYTISVSHAYRRTNAVTLLPVARRSLAKLMTMAAQGAVVIEEHKPRLNSLSLSNTPSETRTTTNT